MLSGCRTRAVCAHALVAGLAAVCGRAQAPPPARDGWQRDQVTVRVRVVSVHGDPVAGAEVFLVARATAARHLADATTDAHGRSRLHLGVGMDGLQVWARAPGRALARAEVPRHHRADELELELVLEDAGRIVGQVVDPRGRPIAGASLLVVHEWWCAAPAPAADFAVSAVDGSYRFDAAPLGRVVVRAAAAGYGVVERELQLDSVRRLDLELVPAPARRSVRVFGIELLGPPDVQWRLDARSHRRRLPVELPALVLRRDGEHVWLPEFEGHEVLLGAASEDLLFDDRPGRSQFLAHVRDHCAQGGRLTDAGGEGLAGVELFLWDLERPGPRHRTVTDGDGVFALRGGFSPYSRVAVALRPRRNAIAAPLGKEPRVAAGGFVAASTAAAMLLEERRAAQLRGAVVDRRGAPVVGARVDLVGATDGVVATARTDAVGAFGFDGLGDACAGARLEVATPTLNGRGEVLRLPAGGAEQVPPITALPPAVLHGRLLDAQGLAVPGWRLLAWPWSDQDGHAVGAPLRCVTDRDGAFTLRVLPGRYRLLPEDRHGGWRWLTGPLSALPGRQQELPLELDRR